MNTVKLVLEHCYGIKQMEVEFTFNRHHTQVVYAPNGMMKSSLARSLMGISGQCKEHATDRLHPELPSRCDVLIDGVAARKEQIYVADPEDSKIDTTKVFSNFLADAHLKGEYDAIYQQLKQYISHIDGPLRGVSISSNCIDELLEAFKENPTDNIFSIMEALAVDVQANTYPNFDFRYNYVFDKDGKVKKFVEKNIGVLQEYIRQYDQLLSTSSVFRTNGNKTFGTRQASKLLKSIEDGEFFDVNHKITLQNGVEIATVNQFSELIEAEKNRILNDEELLKKFNKITGEIDKNEELGFFKDVIVAHPEIILELGDYEGFRKKTWKGYLADTRVRPHLDDYYAFYQSQKDRLNEIIRQAREQLPVWEEIVRIYNDRFHVPFRVNIENQDEIILNQSAAKLQFTYIDSGSAPIEKSQQEMNAILSRGERRAFYILQLLFELEARKVSGQDNLIVFDDIADSFDYQNKYAIIEYLHDLDARFGNIYMLVLTHNFDFYRSLTSRLDLRPCSWMAVKRQNGSIELKPGQYQKDLFSYFVSQDNDDKVFVSMIPFVRNLVEYTDGEGDAKYDTLTSCLHLKSNTMRITEDDVTAIIRHFSKGGGYARPASRTPIYDVIIRTANSIVAEPNVDEVKIENKIVLSIASRLKAEEYLKRQLLAAGLGEGDLVTSSNQTAHWIKLYNTHCSSDQKKSVIEQVNMLTPELIHINSFMYEPLIDLSVHHLIQLYNACSGL